MKKIIFLDIDGVLASYKYLCSSKGFIDPEKVALLNQLEDAEIVISSSWGYDNGKTENSLKSCGLKLPIIGYTCHFAEGWLCRGNEIEKWLCDNIGGMCTKFGDDCNGDPYYRKRYNEDDIDYEYVIFDDNTDILLGQVNNFIHINEQIAITQEDIDKARKILNREV